MSSSTSSAEYRIGSQLPIQEDKHNEFKCHKNLCVEDLPKWAFVKGTMRRSRKAISRTLNAFLNSNIEATVYLGISDEGVVVGLPISEDQKGHMELALEDLMERYVPAVPNYRYKIEYVPAVGVPEPKRRQQKVDSQYHFDPVAPPPHHQLDQSGKEGGTGASVFPQRWSKMQRSSHKLRSSSFCWCDMATQWMLQNDKHVPYYVIEIHIFPFEPQPHIDPIVLQLHPIYQEEEERVYIRGSASVYQLSHQDVAELTRRQVREHFDKFIKSSARRKPLKN